MSLGRLTSVAYFGQFCRLRVFATAPAAVLEVIGDQHACGQLQTRSMLLLLALDPCALTHA
eukprot:179369-Alexandrium_andersonii.AAC.1